MSRFARAMAASLQVEPEQLIAETKRAVIAAPFIFAGFLAFQLLISMAAAAMGPS